jgi:polyisoprenoid-binding protein YceI
MQETAAAPAATSWQIDPTHSSVNFAIRHLMISTVRGSFTSLSGAVTDFAGADSTPKVDVTIDAASIDTGVAPRDEHLRNPDFFDVTSFPTIRFVADEVVGSLDGDFTLLGALTIRDQTRPVSLKVESHGETTDPWGNLRAGFSASGKLNRSDFGLTYNQALEAGGVMLGDEIKFSIDVALVQPTA